MPSQALGQSSGPTAQSFQGSVAQGEASAQPLDLSLDDAMQRGLRNNLGVILNGTQVAGARGQRLSDLQALLPEVDFKAQESVACRSISLPKASAFLAFPPSSGHSDTPICVRSLTWSLVDVTFAAQLSCGTSQLCRRPVDSAQDARDLVVLTVGNAYLLVLADEARVTSVQAQVATSKISLDQAVANHQAGTAPLLDELRARVDYQSLEQQLIVAAERPRKRQARPCPHHRPSAGTEVQPDRHSALRGIRSDRRRHGHPRRPCQPQRPRRHDRADQGAEEQRKATTDERLPKLVFTGDYGDIGVNVSHSHGTGDAQGTLSRPLFKEFGLRGEAQIAQAQLDTATRQFSDMNAQVDADVRDALLDIASAQKQVEVSRSSVDLANEALSEAQQRYANGVSDNLAVSQAEQSRRPGQRSICRQPLPAQRRQAQPGARPGRRSELQELFAAEPVMRRMHEAAKQMAPAGRSNTGSQWRKTGG